MRKSEKWQEPMTETKRDYEVGHCKPPVGRRFQKGQSGNPGGRPKKQTAAPVLVRRLSEQVVVGGNGQRQKTTRTEVLVVQLVDRPAAAGSSAAKILTDVLRDIDKRASLIADCR
jgi:Family of unknown function (DUF5681)